MELGKLTSLTCLECCGGGLTDEAVEELLPLTRMQSLNISQNELVGNPSVYYIASMTNLTSLNVGGTAISSPGAQVLTHLTRLTSLCLSGCHVSHAVMNALQNMPSLLYLTAEPNS